MAQGNTKITQPETMYKNLSDSQLRSMYDESVWFNLGENERLDLLQETVNREAIANGGQYSCKVVFDDLEPGTAGEQRGNTIYMNRTMFVEDMTFAKYDGRVMMMPLNDANLRAYEVVQHEHQHVKQDMISYGVVEADAETRAVFMANNFTISDVNGQEGLQYMIGESGYEFYYLNPTELDAYKTSQEKTMQLAAELDKNAGAVKLSSQIYREQLAETGYEARLEQFRERFGNENIDMEVRNVLVNKFYGTNIPTDKTVEAMVSREMILSKEAIDMEETKMDNKWADLHVTREEYDATLRSSVNQYYEHAMNDPNMSKEEAISSTAQMAENYQNEMAAFDAAQEQQAQTALDTETTTETVTTSVDSEVTNDTDNTVDDGVDDGMDMD